MAERFRVGAVEYLNARPLLWQIESAWPRCCVTLDVPSALATGLLEGAYDVALIPLAAYLAGVGGDIVSGVAIASQGPVGTIKLFAKCPLAQVQTLALDRGSRTSALLARAVLSALYGVRPICVEVEPDMAHLLADADAALVIGQAGLVAEAHPPETTVTVDLGELWTSWQGLPLVAACWVFGEGQCSPEAAQALRDVRDAGVAAIDLIAQSEAADWRLPPELIAHYLRDMLDYSLGPAEIEGIKRYQELLVQEGLLARPRELTFC